MSQVIKSVDGKYYMGEFEEIDPSAVTAMIAKKQQQLADLEAIAPGAVADKIVNAAQDNEQPTAQEAAPANGQPSVDNVATPSGDGIAPATPATDQGQMTAAPAQPEAPMLQ